MKNYTITVNGVAYDVTVEENKQQSGNRPLTNPQNQGIKQARMETRVETAAVATKPIGNVNIEAGAAGKVFKIMKKEGDIVKVAEQIAILEIMKMETPVVATENGTITQIHVVEGEGIEAGQLLFSLQS